MSILSDLLVGKIRQEMKSRVNEVLSAGDQWNATARQLIAALDRLTEAVKAGSVDPKSLEGVTKGTKRLAFETKKLTKAFTNFNGTLERALTKIEG